MDFLILGSSEPVPNIVAPHPDFVGLSFLYPLSMLMLVEWGVSQECRSNS